MTPLNPSTLAELEARRAPSASTLSRIMLPWVRWRTAPALAGAALPSVSIFWAHGENISRHAAAYAELPPTVSRAIADPVIGSPFAIVMIVGAVFLTVAVTQIAYGLAKCLEASPRTASSSWWLLSVMIVFEAIAIAGMVVLSQFTGDQHSLVHDMGSYMLFFGHAIAITGLGVLITRMLGDPALARMPAVRELSSHPRHARWVMGLSIAFGVIYFSGKLVPDAFPYLQHLLFSVSEMAALLAFLSFLGRFHRFLAHSAPGRN
jgi:hypothetical protein